jgi:hypothetical protein
MLRSCSRAIWLTRENKRILRSFADVVSATVLRCCSDDGAKSCFVAFGQCHAASSRQKARTLSTSRPNSTKMKNTHKRKEPLEKKTSIRAAKAQRYLAWLKVKEDPSDSAREELRRCAFLIKERKLARSGATTLAVSATSEPGGRVDTAQAANAVVEPSLPLSSTSPLPATQVAPALASASPNAVAVGSVAVLSAAGGQPVDAAVSRVETQPASRAHCAFVKKSATSEQKQPAARSDWFYQDIAGAVRGPFNAEQMRAWREQHYFDALPDISVRCGRYGAFTPLSSLKNPFSDTPTAPVKMIPQQLAQKQNVAKGGQKQQAAQKQASIAGGGALRS